MPRRPRGGRLPLSQVTSVIDRNPPVLSPMSVLTGIESSRDPAAYLRGLHPEHEQFHLLRKALFGGARRENVAVEKR